MKRLLYTLAVLLCILCSCKKEYLTDDAGGQLVGEWRLEFVPRDCWPEDGWLTCLEDGVEPNDDYRVTIKANGRIVSRKNGERIWCSRLTDVELLHSGSQGDRITIFFKDETIGAGSLQVTYLDGDVLYLKGFPNPEASSEDDPEFGQKRGRFIRQQLAFTKGIACLATQHYRHDLTLKIHFNKKNPNVLVRRDFF